MKRLLRAVAVLMTAVAIPASAQVWDFSGNNLLNGTYVFREAIYRPNPNGTVSQAIVVYGNIVFDGNGNYVINGNLRDSGGPSGPYTNIRGTYSMAPSGYGFIEQPVFQGSLHGTISNGVFIGSSTEAGVNDIMVAVPLGNATNATFTGDYTMNYILPGASPSTSYDSIAKFNANGNGNVGSVPVKSYLGSNVDPIPLTEAGVTYSFSGGIGTLRFPTGSQLPIQGDKTTYISADGNFIFGGSTTGFDFFVGVRRGSATPRMEGLYYTAGINHVPGAMDSFYGAFTARGTVVLEHQRFLATNNGFPSNYTASGILPSSATTEYTDTLSAVEYTISQDASIRIGVGQAPYIGLRIAVRGPKFTAPGSGPFIDPTGVINAASFAPFTSGVAPGELLSIYGSNLASSPVPVVTQGGVPFPSILGGVRVWMNNRPAAIYFVSPGQIAAIVPYGTVEGVVEIRVERDGTPSNTVYAYRYPTAPGIFSQSQSGEGIGAVLHTDYSLVTEANPARPGEVVQVFLTGLGAVAPTIVDGAPGGGTEQTLNRTLPGTVRVFIDNLEGTVSYSGLAPLLSGLYQVNVKVPDDASTDNVYLDISTAAGYTSQVLLPVGSAIAADVPSRKAEARPFVRRR